MACWYNGKLQVGEEEEEERKRREATILKSPGSVSLLLIGQH